jgi:tetratricopeptide (TPR) repeat protein
MASQPSNFYEIMTFLSSNWPVFLFLFSILAVLIGWLVYRVHPLQPLEEIAHKQRQYMAEDESLLFKKRMVNRHLELGNTFLGTNQLEAAKIEFQRALELDATNVKAQMGVFKSDVFEPITPQRIYDPEVMKKKLMLILKENPEDPHALSFMGNVYLYVDRKKAEEFFKRATAQDSSIAAGYYGLGLIHDIENRLDEALEMYEKALSLSEWNQHYLNNVAYKYLQKKQYKQAIEKYYLLLNLDQRYLLAYYTISNAYRLKNDFYSAKWYQNRLLALMDDEATTSLKRNIGAWFFHVESDKIIQFFDFPKKRCYAYFNIALTSYLLGLEEESKAFLEKARELETPEEPSVKELVNFDISVLEKEQPDTIEKLNGFKQNFFLPL